MPHICPFCQRELPALGELSHYCLTLPPSPTRQGVEPDEKVADEQPAGHLSRLILPPHSALPPSVFQIEGIVAWLTEGRGKVVNVKIVCDQCGRGYSYARARGGNDPPQVLSMRSILRHVRCLHGDRGVLSMVRRSGSLVVGRIRESRPSRVGIQASQCDAAR